MKSNWRSLTHAALLLALGAGAYYGLDMADQAWLSSFGLTTEPIPAESIPRVNLPEEETTLPGQRAGDPWIAQALVRLEQRLSIEVKLKQVGWVSGRLVETYGEYRQLGSGNKQKFLFSIQGQLAGRPAKLFRVCDGRYLFTDLVWRANDVEEVGRSITRVDLRRLRKDANSAEEPPAPGAAVAQIVKHDDWSRYGGLPMLVASLNEHFDFSTGRAMQLRGREVIAVVGRWNRGSVEQMYGHAGLPESAPRLVVVALDKETLFPLLVEYRALGDPLANAQLPDESLLPPSRRPMLKIELIDPEFDTDQPKQLFAYSRPDGVEWTDQTDLELSLARERRERVAESGAVLR